MKLRALPQRLACPRSRLVLAGAAVFLVDQTLYQLIGSTVWLQGPLDETAHLLTTLMIFWAIRKPAFDRLLLPALVASVAIDVDHVPEHLGYDWLTAGTSRPYTHSLATIAVLLAVASTARSGRKLFLGLAIGVASHLWRDLAEPSGSGIAAFWPFSVTRCTIPSAVYLFGMSGIGLVALYRSRHPMAREKGQPRTHPRTAPRRAGDAGPGGSGSDRRSFSGWPMALDTQLSEGGGQGSFRGAGG